MYVQNVGSKYPKRPLHVRFAVARLMHLGKSPLQVRFFREKGKKKGIFAVICIGILVIAALLAVYFTQLSPVAQQRKAFDAATELYNSGEYADALHSFEQLGD